MEVIEVRAGKICLWGLTYDNTVDTFAGPKLNIEEAERLPEALKGPSFGVEFKRAIEGGLAGRMMVAVEGRRMRLELYYDSSVEPFASAGFDAARIFRLLDEAKNIGIMTTVYDTAGWNRDMLREIYLKACIPAMLKRYRIRDIFGGRRKGGGIFFGRQVPALLVVEDDRVAEVYPHREGDRFIKISDFLENLIAGIKRDEE